MSNQPDYSALDNPEILYFLFYPRKDVTTAPPNASDYLIPADKGVSISCRLYTFNQDSPSIIYFHGNGEVVSDHDYIAPLYTQLGINLFVADYRGYGASGGSPTFGNMLADAPVVFKALTNILHQNHYSDDIFVMGRSLGGGAAIEIACRYQQQLKGLIIESSFATIKLPLSRWGFPIESLGFKDTEFPNLSKIRTITIPTLIIHGEYDSLTPPTEAEALHHGAAAKDKRLVIIPKADHNDLMWIGVEYYLKAIKQFVFP